LRCNIEGNSQGWSGRLRGRRRGTVIGGRGDVVRGEVSRGERRWIARGFAGATCGFKAVQVA
jgi:hypothetical protein